MKIASALLPVFSALLGAGTGSEVAGPEVARCAPPLTAVQRESAIDYFRKKYAVPKSVALAISRESAFRDTCYRELVLQGASDIRTWEVTLYMSPDLRFLSTDLFDLKVDPLEEQRVQDAAVLNGLTTGATAIRGPDNARVTIVAFSDFECPFCKKFADTLDSIASGDEDVRVVFHHLPLSMHKWARVAAEGAACAQLQSRRAFWAIHDDLFRNQAIVTIDNVKDKLRNFADTSAELDRKAFEACLDNGMSVGLVLRDLKLAETYEVNGTPTVFINGRRLPGVENAAELRRLINAARNSGDVGAVPNSSAKASAKMATDTASCERGSRTSE